MNELLEKTNELSKKNQFWSGALAAVFVCLMAIMWIPAKYGVPALCLLYCATLCAACVRLYQFYRAVKRLKNRTTIPDPMFWLLYKQSAVANAMQKYGGSFTAALGNALSHADFTNVKRIYDTWPDEWDKYLKMANDNEQTE